MIKNESGKDFKDISFKILLGDVNKKKKNYNSDKDKSKELAFTIDGMSVSDPIDGGRALSVDMGTVADMKVMMGGFTAEYGNSNDIGTYSSYSGSTFSSSNSYEKNERKFSDYQIYNLNLGINMNINQCLKCRLTESKSIPAKKKYTYTTFEKTVNSSIEFINSSENELGLPRTNGNMRVYEKDVNDKQLEFIGEASVDLTKTDQNVVIQTGRSFDINAKTSIVKESENFIRYKKKIEVLLENKTDREIEIEIKHLFYGTNWTIENNNFTYTKEEGSRSILIKEVLAPKSKKTLKWDQRVK